MKIINYSMQLTWSLAISLVTLIILISSMGEHHVSAHPDNNSTQWQTYQVMGKITTLQSSVNQTFNFQYRAINGTVESIHLKQPIDAIEVNISNQNGNYGLFEIKIPKNYPYTNENLTSPTNLIILLNGQAVKNFDMETKDCFFDYSIPFSEGNFVIDLIFTYIPEYGSPHGDIIPQRCISETISSNSFNNVGTVIPEFPFAIPILLAGIASLIVFYRTRFRQ